MFFLDLDCLPLCIQWYNISNIFANGYPMTTSEK